MFSLSVPDIPPQKTLDRPEYRDCRSDTVGVFSVTRSFWLEVYVCPTARMEGTNKKGWCTLVRDVFFWKLAKTTKANIDRTKWLNSASFWGAATTARFMQSEYKDPYVCDINHTNLEGYHNPLFEALAKQPASMDWIVFCCCSTYIFVTLHVQSSEGYIP